MRYGVLLVGEHAPNELVELTGLITDLGYHTLWYADERFYRDAYVGLAIVAMNSRGIRLGTCVTDPYSRHPALTAVAMASVAELAPGRAILGIGAGGSGFEALGIDRTKPVAALREAIAIIRRLWDGEAVTVEGKVVSCKGLSLGFRAPAQIPIVVAATGPQLIALAGEIADGVIVGDYASVRALTHARDLWKKGAAKAGRSLAGNTYAARLNLAISEDGKAARDSLRGWVGAVLWDTYPGWDMLFNYSPDWQTDLKPFVAFIESHGRPRGIADYDKLSDVVHLISEELVMDHVLAGTPDQIALQIAELETIGVNELVLFPSPMQGQSLREVLHLFAEQVMPRVAAGSGP
jgi:5,10-methylenetetrahydromethanopterin reductase